MISAEQKDARRKGIGSSDIPAILGISPFKNHDAYHVWLSKKFGDESGETESMTLGNKAEKLIVEEFAERNPQLQLIATDAMIYHKSIPWAFANCDAVFSDGENLIPVEAKYIGAHMLHHWDTSIASGAPAYVKSQTLWQIFCTNAPHGYIMAWMAGSEFVQFDQPRLQKKIDAIYRRAAEFWEICQGDEPPDPNDPRWIKRQSYAERPENGALMQPTPELLELVAKYRAAKEAAEMACGIEDRSKAAIIKALGPFSGIEGILTYRWDKAGKKRTLRFKEEK